MISIFSLGCIIGYFITYIINWFVKKEEQNEYLLTGKICIGLLTGVLFSINYLINGFKDLTLYTSVLIILFELIAFIDLRCLIIPDMFNILIMGFSLILIFGFDVNLWIDSVDIIGVIIFNSLLLIIVIIVYKIRKIEILGFGDIKLLFGIGMLFGLTNFSYALVVASLAALFVEVIILKKKRDIIPYGPYLTFGFLLIWFFQLNY